MILELCGIFQSELDRPTQRSHAIPVSLQIMVAVRLYATVSFQLVNADLHHILRASVSYIARDVTQCMKNVCNQYISMLKDQKSLHALKQGFYDISSFPNAIGAVDGTHVRFKSQLLMDTYT